VGSAPGEEGLAIGGALGSVIMCAGAIDVAHAFDMIGQAHGVAILLLGQGDIVTGGLHVYTLCFGAGLGVEWFKNHIIGGVGDASAGCGCWGGGSAWCQLWRGSPGPQWSRHGGRGWGEVAVGEVAAGET